MCVVNELLFATSILGNMDQGEKEWRYLHAKRVKHTPPSMQYYKSHSQNMLGLVAIPFFIGIMLIICLGTAFIL